MAKQRGKLDYCCVLKPVPLKYNSSTLTIEECKVGSSKPQEENLMNKQPDKPKSKNNGLYKRGNTWSYVVNVPDPITGKKKQMWRGGFASEEEAKQARENIKAEIQLGIHKEPSKLTVEEYLLDWFENIHKPTIKPSTARGYEVNIRNHIIPYIGKKKLAELNRNDLTKLYNLLQQSGNVKSKVKGQKPGLSPTTIKYVHNVLSKSLKEAVLSGLIDKNPCDGVKLPKRQKYKAGVLNQDQIFKLLDAGKSTEIYLPLLFGLVLGLRRGEAMGLRFSDFDFEKGTVHIQKQITVVKSSKESKTGETEYGFSSLKTAESDRVLYVPQHVLQAVKEQQQQCRINRMQHGKEYTNLDLVCCNEKGGFYNPNTMYTKYKNLLAQLGLPSIRFHDLRHSYATAMIESHVPLKTVSHMLGHKDIGITANIYCDVINSHKEAAIVAETFFFHKTV